MVSNLFLESVPIFIATIAEVAYNKRNYKSLTLNKCSRFGEAFMEDGANAVTPKTEIVKADLGNGITIRIEATSLGGEERVAYHIPSFQEVTDAVEGIAQAMLTTLQKVKPRAASVEFGLEIGIESGQLTALLVKGTGTANLKITLEWGEINPIIQP
jgi:hypothetical protein